MTANVKARRALSTDDVVVAVVTELHRRECTVAEAVETVWNRGRFGPEVVTELARSGLTSRVNDALSKLRFTSAPVAGQRDTSTAIIQRLRVVASKPSPVTLVTLYPVFATRYAAADGCVRPIAKFLFADVEATLRRLDAEISGLVNVRDWFRSLRGAMEQEDVTSVADLSDARLAALSKAAPFETDD